MANIKNVRFDQFIGIFDTDYDTRPLIEYWKYQDKCGATFQRYGIFGKPERKAHVRKDKCLATEDFMLDHQCGYEYMNQYNLVVGACLEKYINEYESLMNYRYQQAYLNVQRTLPGEGFHAFHAEDGSMGCNRRLMATMMYLNTVEDGGETEFLYQHRRFKPIAGQVLIWPAGFTHTHRGLPPLSGEKFIATSWLENINM
tara:strand:+ start:21 stop:620 length:600 start_codon:yes stop_codon:yes gene_type:complete